MPTSTLQWSSSDSNRNFASLSLVYSIICRSSAEHTQKPTINNRSVFSVRAGSEPALQTNSLPQPHLRCTTADATLRAILDSQLQRKSAMRSKQPPHLLHLGHTPTMKQAKGNWLPHNKPTSAARKQRSVQLLVGINSAELDRSVLNWAESVSSCNSASATARETAGRISIEQQFRSMAGKHATALAFICMLLIVTLSLVYSFYPYHAVPSATIYSCLIRHRGLVTLLPGWHHDKARHRNSQLSSNRWSFAMHTGISWLRQARLVITRSTQRLSHGELASPQLTQHFYTQYK